MLVDGYKGQKVQDVKKPIQKMMVEKVGAGLCLRPLCNVYYLLLSKNVDASASLVFRVRPASTWSQKNRSCRVRLTSAWWRSVISGERHKSSATMELSHVCRIQMRTFVW